MTGSNRITPTQKMRATGYSDDKIAGLYKGARWKMLAAGFIVEEPL